MKQPKIIPWVFLSPFIISIALFFVYAAARVMWFAFTDYNLFNEPQFVGFENFVNLFNDVNFGYAVRNTLIYAVLVTLIQTTLALVLAAILNMRIRGINFFRSGFYLPSVTSSVVITVIFLWFFQRRGLFNFLLTELNAALPFIAVFLFITALLQVILVFFERGRGMPARPFELSLLLVSMLIAFVITFILSLTGVLLPGESEVVDIVWLNTRETFFGIPRPLVAIMIQNIFTTIPTLMLIFLAGLQDVPPPLYEAATIDGADARQKFFYITLPSLRPVLFLVLTLSLIGTLQMFDQVAIFGDAVPLESVITLAYYVYNRMFPGGTLPQVGLASAAALFLALVTISAVLIQRAVVGSEGDK